MVLRFQSPGDPNPMLFFCLFFLYHVLCIKQLLGTKTTCSASYGKEKTPSPLIHLAPGKKPSTQGLSGTRPTAHQRHKIRNQTPTKGAEQGNQINTRG